MLKASDYRKRTPEEDRDCKIIENNWQKILEILNSAQEEGMFVDLKNNFVYGDGTNVTNTGDALFVTDIDYIFSIFWEYRNELDRRLAEYEYRLIFNREEKMVCLMQIG